MLPTSCPAVEAAVLVLVMATVIVSIGIAGGVIVAVLAGAIIEGVGAGGRAVNQTIPKVMHGRDWVGYVLVRICACPNDAAWVYRVW